MRVPLTRYKPIFIHRALAGALCQCCGAMLCQVVGDCKVALGV